MIQPIRQLLEDRIGLDAASLGERAFDHAVKEAGAKFANPKEYADAVATDRREFDELLERLMIRETWFYRGRRTFEYLANHLARLAGVRVVRILSAPCSTGEEPYSLAIALAEAGVPASQYEIHAIDLSRAAIIAANRGVYREFSFRELPRELKLKYFRECEGGWELDPTIRGRVRFVQGNVLDPGSGVFDVILCRNMLIYFTPAARRQAVDNLLDLLAPDGLLGVGHAEPAAIADRNLVAVGTGEMFLFQRSATPAKTWSLPEYVSTPPPPVVQHVRTHVPAKSPPPEPIRTPASVQELADRGQLADALAECQRLLAERPDAEVYALMGVIHQAGGAIDAAKDAFRKALYLDPKNATALAMSRISGAGA
jgi:chemotaxis protein methyltransferase WspC